MPEFPTLLLFDEAVRVLRDAAATRRLPAESLPLAHCHGRVLAADVHAPIALQPFDNSAMDGFACRRADLPTHTAVSLHLVGEQFAGPACAPAIGPGECVRITTGAPLPEGADFVVIREDSRVEGDRVLIEPGIVHGEYVRHAGEDCRAGDRVLLAGTALQPAQVALAAALGLDRLPVARLPTVAVFTGGDELVAPGLPLQRGQIYDSNRELLMGLLRADGLQPVAWPALPDDPARIAAVLSDAAANFDLVLTCGGVSVGEKDLLPRLLAEQGQVRFWKVRMKPGMPVLSGTLGRAEWLGLPGNPVAVLASYLTLVRSLLDGMQGRAARPRLRARLRDGVHKTHPRREFLRGALACDDDGMLWIDPNAQAAGSHRLRAAAEADALLVVPEGPQTLQRGDVVDVLPY